MAPDQRNLPQSFMVGHDYHEDRGIRSIRNVYEALREIECAGCGKAITEGQRFTRRKMQGGGPALYPMCQECEPFTAYEPLPPDTRSPKPGERLKGNVDVRGYGSGLGSL